ncbi:MAG: RDD family protein [Elusimicrobiaceae bacterium]|nr:RDD family protein [Elusimicrobiaceae bacterium]
MPTEDKNSFPDGQASVPASRATLSLHVSGGAPEPAVTPLEQTVVPGPEIDTDGLPEEAGPLLASFSERFVAYVIDALPFFVLCYASLYHMARTGAVTLSLGLLLKWNLFWIGFYWLYVTVFTAGGRVTVGKAIMGLRVRDASGGDISLFRAGVRTFGYFISSAVFYLGYILAFFTGYALHDHLVGTYVERVRPRSAAGSVVTVLLSWAFFSVFFYSWIYGTFLRTSPDSQILIDKAQNGLYGLARLEALHKDKYGYYTNSLGRLAALTGDPARFKKDLMQVYRENGFVLSGDKEVFEISARALDFKGTRVKLAGPPEPVRAYYKKKDYEKYISH